MAFLSFAGNLVGATKSINDDGSGGVDIELDTAQDLDGSGNPYYASTDVILVEIDDADIGPDGEILASGADGKVTVLSIKVNGVEQLAGPDNIKFSGSGTDSFEGDAFFFVEGIKLTFLAEEFGVTFEDSVLGGGKLELNIAPRVADIDLDNSGQVDAGTAEIGDGIFNINAVNVVCFTQGTRILTPTGEKPVETIQKGDLVLTLNARPRAVKLVLHRNLHFPEAPERLKPIEFKPGCLGAALPMRTLRLSPQHRVLVTSEILESVAGAKVALVPAKGLLGLKGVRQMKGCRRVDYYHLVFDGHEVVFSEGLATESLFPGPEALRSVTTKQRKELLEIFPDLKGPTNCTFRPSTAGFTMVGAGKAIRHLQSRNRFPARGVGKVSHTMH